MWRIHPNEPQAKTSGSSGVSHFKGNQGSGWVEVSRETVVRSFFKKIYASVPAFLRRGLAEQQEQPAREQGQAAVRIVIQFAVLAYLVSQSPVSLDTRPPTWLIYLLGYLGFSVIIMMLAFRRARALALRRVITIIGDIFTISYLMVATGVAGIPLFMFYLWVTLGNGFRFGLASMFFSAALSLVGFSAVVVFSQVWRELVTVSVSVTIALIVLPTYAAHLIHQLETARTRAEEANAAKSRFLARMSHELRTPLNGILGTTELLAANKRLMREDRALLDVIKESVNVSLRQIDNILDFSKIEAGKLIIESIEFDLHEVLNRAVRIVRGIALEKNLRLMLRIDPLIPYRLVGDPHHLHEVLLNLLSNAVKFTERGYISLEAHRVQYNDDTVTVRFEMRDTGVGIEAEALGRVFEAFSQEDTATTRRYGGTGLGTTISRQLIELMGGKLEVISKKGEGSTFYADIRFASAPAANLEGTQLAGMRLLLVSENNALRQHVSSLMEGQGVSLVVVPSITEAAGLLGRGIRLGNPIHVVLVDGNTVLAGGVHRGDDFLEKAWLSFTPTFLMCDVSPGEAQLREWGYAATLPNNVTREILFNALHSSGLCGTDSERGVIRVEPWAWGQPVRRRARLLIADDNRTNLMILRRMLETANYEVDSAEDGEQALEMMLNGRYKAAVLDMHMPGLDGVEVVRQYRLLRRGARIPIVMLTANATVDAKLASAESGADAYLTKPATAAAIVGTIEKLLEETEVYDISRLHTAVAGTSAAELPVLDMEIMRELDRLYDDDVGVVRIIGEFEQESRRLMEELTAAVETKNHATFCDLLHALKGNGANVGALRLVRACHDLESQGLLDFRREGKGIIERLEGELNEATRSLHELTATGGPGAARGSDLPS